MEFRILGPLEVWEADRRLTLGGPKHRALLAILLLEANRVVSTDRLVDLLWGDEPSETVNNTLQVCVSQLRKVLEPLHSRGAPYEVLVSQPPGYLVRVGSDQLDSERFERLVADARERGIEANPELAGDLLRHALDLWHGPPLADFATEAFALPQARRLSEMRMGAVEDRIQTDLALGRHAALIGELEALVSQHPLRERLRGHLMLALYRSGRQAESSDVFHSTRTVLVDELGMEPGAELQKLFKRILNQDPSLDLTLRTEAAVPRKTDNLPLPLTSFVGRTPDVAEVKRLSSRSRLLTLTGAGGIGKTRLALKVAADLVGSLADGVWLVELAPLGDPDRVPQTVAAALGVREQSGVPITDSLISYLGTRQMLLVLDNCEHLVEASAKLVNDLLRSCPHLRVLATSREALGVDGESTWRVPSLGLHDPDRPPPPGQSADYGAITLFAERAATTLGSFELAGKDAELAQQLCQRLDGIPLAIELAAGKLNVLTLQQITRRLDDRFRLLTGGSRTALPRQKTLEATLDWSYELLSEAEQALLRTLSAFAGGFTLEAAEAACPRPKLEVTDVLETLSRLVDKSLVSTVSKNRELRYYLLETVRHYAYWKLRAAGEDGDAQERHRDWFLTLAEQAESQLRGPDQVLWFERIETELDNLRTAFEWSLENGETNAGARLACAISYFWEFEGHITEGRQWFARLKPKTPAEPTRLWARATAWAAHLAGDQYDYEVGIQLAEQSLVAARALEDPSAISFSLMALGNAYMIHDNLEKGTEAYRESLHYSRASANKADIARSLGKLGQTAWIAGSYADAAGFLAESIELNREIGDRWRLGVGQGILASVALSQGRLSAARQLLADSLIPLQAVNDEYGVCLALYKLGILARCEHEYVQAEHLVEKAIEPLRKLGERVLINYCLCELGIVYGLQGKREEAILTLKKAAEDGLEVGDRWGLSKCLEAIAVVQCKAGERKQAALFFGAAEALREAIGVPLESYEQADNDTQVKALLAGPDRDVIRKEWAAGRTMPIRDVIAYLPELAGDKVKPVVTAISAS